MKSILEKLKEFTVIEIIVILVIALILIAIILPAIDASMGESMQDEGTIIGKKYKRASTTMVSTTNANGMVTMTPIHNPEKFTIIIRSTYNNFTISCSTYSARYEALHIDQEVKFDYTTGGLTGARYCDSFDSFNQ